MTCDIERLRPGRFDHGAAKLKGLKSQLRMLRRKRKKFQNFEEASGWSLLNILNLAELVEFGWPNCNLVTLKLKLFSGTSPKGSCFLRVGRWFKYRLFDVRTYPVQMGKELLMPPLNPPGDFRNGKWIPSHRGQIGTFGSFEVFTIDTELGNCRWPACFKIWKFFPLKSNKTMALSPFCSTKTSPFGSVDSGLAVPWRRVLQRPPVSSPTPKRPAVKKPGWCRCGA